MAKRVLKAICLILMSALLVLNVFTMLLSGLGLSERLNWLPGALLSVESGSMEPIFSEGDLLLVWETPYEELRVGDIVTFHQANELVTHRIVRQEGDRFVPQGVANHVEDPPIGRMEYCAKVVGIIPHGGIVLDLLTNPVGLVTLLLLVLVSFFGVPAMHWFFARSDRSATQPMRVGASRVLAAGTVMSLCCVVPFLTSSKYVAEINEYGFASAGITYFSSNYLTQNDESHFIKGWGGKGYGLTLELRNYENDLLRSKKNLIYDLEIEIVSGTGLKNGYTIKVSDSDQKPLGEATADRSFRYQNTLSGSQSTADSLPKTQFQIEVIVPENYLSAKDRIQFRIEAKTVNAADFNQVLKGNFTFEVAEAGSFLGDETLVERPGTALVTYNIKTVLIDDVPTREVIVSWPSEKVYINLYESTVANIVAHDPDAYYEGNGINDRGYLKMSLRAYSNVALQFFKYNPNLTLAENDIRCDVGRE